MHPDELDLDQLTTTATELFFSDMKQLKSLIQSIIHELNQEYIEKEVNYNKQRNFFISKMRRDDEKI